MRSLFDPQGFYFFAGKTIKPLFALAAVIAAVALYLGFFVCPIDATQGNSYRIIFIHVSSAAHLRADGGVFRFRAGDQQPHVLDLCRGHGAHGCLHVLPCAFLGRRLGPSDLGGILGLGCSSYE